MPRPAPLSEWGARRHPLPHLPAAHARRLAEWSFGMVLAHAVHLTAVVHPAAALGQTWDTMRQRLRKPFQPSERKAGTAPPSTRTPAASRWCGG